MIRPVKASPAPPVPSPPRRDSGFGTRGSQVVVESQASIETERFDDEQEMPTANGVGEPSTLNRGPITVPREMVQATPRGGRGNVMHLQFEDETQARPVENHVLDKLRHDAVVTPVRPVKADLGVEYEALPSLEVRAPYDSYDAPFSEHDPVTQAARESAHVRRAEARAREDAAFREPSYQEPSYREPEPSYPAAPNARQDEEEFWGRREDSGPRSRPVPQAARSYAAPVPAYDDDSHSEPWGDPPPPPAPPPQAAPVTVGYPASPAFVMGVQPIRTSTPDAWGVPQVYGQPQVAGQGYLPAPMQVMQAPAMPPGYAVPGYGAPANQVHPYVVAAPPRSPNPTPYPPQPQGYYQQPHQQQHQQQQPSQQQPYPMQQRHAMPASGPVMSPSAAQPVGGQLAPSAAAKVGRFAWFVAGAAFGITFAFFATGFFSGSAGSGSAKSAKEELPAAAPLPTLTQPAVQPVAPAPVVPAAMAPVAPATPVAPAFAQPVPQPPVAAQQGVAPFAQPQQAQPQQAQPQSPVVGLPQQPATSP
ncbi:MAG TPA: hypothetical protein VLT33_30970, partial [Labilithrix sp.]|nr:hypothetical protein [Labilithrix sp.]